MFIFRATFNGVFFKPDNMSEMSAESHINLQVTDPISLWGDLQNWSEDIREKMNEMGFETISDVTSLDMVDIRQAHVQLGMIGKLMQLWKHFNADNKRSSTMSVPTSFDSVSMRSEPASYVLPPHIFPPLS